MSSLSNSLGYHLKYTQHHLRGCMDEQLRAIELTTPQYAVLSAMAATPGLSNAELARASFVTPQTMHGIVSNLAKKGWLKREPDPAHGRILKTTLTAKGEKILTQAQTIIRRLETRMTKNIKQKDIAHFKALLDQFTHNLQQL